MALSAVGGSNLKLLLARAHRSRSDAHDHLVSRLRGVAVGVAQLLDVQGHCRSEPPGRSTVSVSEGLGAALASDWHAYAPRQRSILNPVFFPKTTRVPSAAELAARPDVILSGGAAGAGKGLSRLCCALSPGSTGPARGS